MQHNPYATTPAHPAPRPLRMPARRPHPAGHAPSVTP